MNSFKQMLPQSKWKAFIQAQTKNTVLLTYSLGTTFGREETSSPLAFPWHSSSSLTQSELEKLNNEAITEGNIATVETSHLDSNLELEQPLHEPDSPPPPPPRTPCNRPQPVTLLSPASGIGVVVAEKPEDPFSVVVAASFSVVTSVAGKAPASITSSLGTTEDIESDPFTSSQLALTSDPAQTSYSLPTPPQRQPQQPQPQPRLRRRRRFHLRDQQTTVSHCHSAFDTSKKHHQEDQDGPPPSSIAN